MKKLKEVRKEIEEIGGPKHHQKALVKRALDRFKGMSKELAVRVSHAVKPGKMINSKLYVELGDLWDKGKKKDFEKHLAKNESVEENLQALVKPAEKKAQAFSRIVKRSVELKSKELSRMQKRQLIKHYNDLGKGKLSALDKIKKLLKDDVNESINEDKFQLVDMSRKTAKIADKLAQKAGLDTDFEGGVLGVQLTVHGTKKKIEKWLQSLPLEEGMYTRDDGGAYDGLRIAKYLAHQDGKKWKGLPYGTLSSYIDDGMEMLKRNKAKARDILSKPTPRD
jgi:hypothetical protein